MKTTTAPVTAPVTVPVNATVTAPVTVPVNATVTAPVTVPVNATVTAPVTVPINTYALTMPVSFSEVITPTKRQMAAFNAATRVVDSIDAATAGNKVLQNFGLSALKVQQLDRAVALMAKKQFTPASRLVDAWLCMEFGELSTNTLDGLQNYLAGAHLKTSETKATKSKERKLAILRSVEPIYNALALIAIK